MLDAPKKVVKGQVHPFDHILKHLRRHVMQVRADVFAFRQLRTLVFIGEGDARHAIGTCAFIERRIVELAAQAEPLLKRVALLVGRIDAKEIRFTWLRFFLRLGFGLVRYAFVAQCTLIGSLIHRFSIEHRAIYVKSICSCLFALPIPFPKRNAPFIPVNELRGFQARMG